MHRNRAKGRGVKRASGDDPPSAVGLPAGRSADDARPPADIDGVRIFAAVEQVHLVGRADDDLAVVADICGCATPSAGQRGRIPAPGTRLRAPSGGRARRATVRSLPRSARRPMRRSWRTRPVPIPIRTGCRRPRLRRRRTLARPLPSWCSRRGASPPPRPPVSPCASNSPCRAAPPRLRPTQNAESRSIPAWRKCSLYSFARCGKRQARGEAAELRPVELQAAAIDARELHDDGKAEARARFRSRRAGARATAPPRSPPPAAPARHPR